MEVSYISTSILAAGAICVAPELMRFLYTEKYASYGFAVTVFIIYIMVDIISVLNITLILSAAGKTKAILFSSIGTLAANVILNVGMFTLFKEIGPAVATLIVTLIQGIVILSLGAKEIKINIFKMFVARNLLIFLIQVVVCFVIFSVLRTFLIQRGIYYLLVLFVVYGLFVVVLLLLNFNRITNNLRTMNECKRV